MQQLLIDLFFKIDQMLDDQQAALFRVDQVKEKFGGLRVYYAVGDSSELVLDLISPQGVARFRKPPEEGRSGFPEIDKLIADAVALAHATCERCGEPGPLRPSRWTRVLCNSCAERIAQERGE
jgi:hypothetical protein